MQAVLAARIDRLPAEDKRLLQTAAVIGKDVPFALLQAIAELPEEALHRGLAHLQAAEFLYETRLFPDLEYTFKHALTHEVAYGSLLQERRRALHARIVEAIERARRGPAGRARRAAGPPRPAGRGLGQGGHLPPAGRRQGLGAVGQPGGGGVLRAGAGGPATSPGDPRDAGAGHRSPLRPRAALLALGALARVHETLQTADVLATALGDPGRQGRVVLSMALHFIYTGAYDHSLAASERALALATTSGDVGGQVQAKNYLGIAFHALGDYGRVMEVLRYARAVLTSVQCTERFGQVSLLAVLTRTQ